MTAWHTPYEPAPLAEIERVGAPSWDVFLRQSDRITATVEAKLHDHPPASGPGRVLDFGAGIGRVALNLSARCGLPTDACDVNAAAIAYLSSQLPGADCRVTPERPPLPYADGTFDAVYAISVWTHLPPAAELAVLEEMRRILKPSGVLLVSVCGPAGIAHRRAQSVPGWAHVDEEALDREGILFVPYADDPQPGITLPYGLTAHSHHRIASVWDGILAVEAVYPAAIDGIQDLVVLRRRPA